MTRHLGRARRAGPSQTSPSGEGDGTPRGDGMPGAVDGAAAGSAHGAPVSAHGAPVSAHGAPVSAHGA
ncbi:MAG TPA: hypothetical protein VI248_12220, partial [Kineosporiaceae bacterium]